MKYVEKEETEQTETDGNTDKKTETNKNNDDNTGEDFSDNAKEKYVNKILLILFASML